MKTGVGTPHPTKKALKHKNLRVEEGEGWEDVVGG